METKLTKEQIEKAFSERVKIDRKYPIRATSDLKAIWLDGKDFTESFYLPQIEERDKMIEEAENVLKVAFADLRFFIDKEKSVAKSIQCDHTATAIEKLLQSIQSLKQKDK